MRKKTAYPLDGIPLVMGMAGLLRQFHPQVTRALIAYLGQFIRTNIQIAIGDPNKTVDTDGGKQLSNITYPYEVLNTIVFLDLLVVHAGLPRAVAHEFVPPYIFDTIKI